MKNRTTLQLEKETLIKLKKLKKYPSETHEEVLLRLIKQEIEKPKKIFIEEQRKGSGFGCIGVV